MTNNFELNGTSNSITEGTSGDLGLSLAESFPLLSTGHLEKYPFEAPSDVSNKVLYYEGSFDPFGNHHKLVFGSAMALGFQKAVLGIVFQNPYKARPATAYQHRREMAKIMVESLGYEVIETYEEFMKPDSRGVFIASEVIHFHFIRECALRSWRYYILIGADNFDRAMMSDVLWCHVPDWVENPQATSRYGFRSLYTGDETFARRILIASRLYEVHSTNIRAGEEKMPEELDDYVRDNELYFCAKKEDGECAVPNTGTILTPPPSIKRSVEELMVVEALLGNLKSALADVKLASPEVEVRLRYLLSGSDKLQLAWLTKALNSKAVDIRSTEESILSLPAIDSFRLVQEAVVDGLSKKAPFTTAGGHHVIEALQSGKRVLLVGNHSGWANYLMLPLTFAKEKISSCTRQLNFVGRAARFPNSATAQIFGRSVRQTQVRKHTEGDKLASALSSLFSRYSGEIGVMFPEGQWNQRRMTEFREGYFTKFAQRNCGNTLKDVLVLPFAQIGGQSITESKGLSADYFQVVIGKPIEASELCGIAHEHGADTLAHFLGRCVARLLPRELRGLYGPVDLLEEFDGDYETSSESSIILSADLYDENEWRLEYDNND